MLFPFVEFLVVLQYLLRRIRVIAHQPQMIPKANQQNPVLRPQDLLQKNFQVLLVLLSELILAPAHIHNQRQRQRQICAPRKKLDLLRHRIFQQLHILPLQAFHQLPLRIPRRERHIHQLHIHLDRSLPHRNSAQARGTHQQAAPQYVLHTPLAPQPVEGNARAPANVPYIT